jgi:hypothetical protein
MNLINKIMKHLIICFFLFLSVDLLSQNIQLPKDSISNLIHEKRDSLSLLIRSNNKATFINIFEFLKAKEDDHSLTLYPNERWLIDYCLEDYYDILATTLVYDSIYISSVKHKFLPQRDSLNYILVNYVRQYLPVVNAKIDNSSLQQDKTDLLKLILRSCLYNFKNPVIDQVTINAQAEKFIHDNPESRFNSFIKSNILFDIIPSKFGLSFDIALGVGNYTKSFSNYFGQNGFATLGIELSYKRLDFAFRYNGGSSIVQKEFIVDNVIWQEKIHPDVMLPELSLGYNILDLKHFRVIPYGGVSFLKLTPSDKDRELIPDLNDTRIKMPMYMMGLTFDFKYKLHHFDSYYGSHNNNFGLIRLRYAFGFPSDDYNGNLGYMNYLTIGWGISLKGVQFENDKTQ